MSVGENRHQRLRAGLKRPEQWAKRVLVLAQTSARAKRRKGRDVHCSITSDEIEAMGTAQGMRCWFTGLPFELSGGQSNDHYPSLDRQNSDGDYSIDNCRLVAWWVNRARNRTPPREFVENLIRTYETFGTAQCHSELHTKFQQGPAQTMDALVKRHRPRRVLSEVRPPVDPRQLPIPGTLDTSTSKT